MGNVCGVSSWGNKESWEEGRGLECPGKAGEKSSLGFPVVGRWIVGGS